MTVLRPPRNEKEVARWYQQVCDAINGLTIKGAGAPTGNPEVIGQRYEDTTTGTVYVSVGTWQAV